MRSQLFDDPSCQPTRGRLLDKDGLQVDRSSKDVVEGRDEPMERMSDHHHPGRPASIKHLLHILVTNRLLLSLVVPGMKVCRINVCVNITVETGRACFERDAENQVARQVLDVFEVAEGRKYIFPPATAPIIGIIGVCDK